MRHFGIISWTSPMTIVRVAFRRHRTARDKSTKGIRISVNNTDNTAGKRKHWGEPVCRGQKFQWQLCAPCRHVDQLQRPRRWRYWLHRARYFRNEPLWGKLSAGLRCQQATAFGTAWMARAAARRTITASKRTTRKPSPRCRWNSPVRLAKNQTHPAFQFLFPAPAFETQGSPGKPLGFD